MPEITDTTPRAKVDILSLKDLTLPEPYITGHVLTDEEARFMNTRLRSIMVNGYGGDLRRAMDVINTKRAEEHKEGKYTGPVWTTEGGKEDGKKLREPVPAEATVEDLRDEKGEPWDHQARLDRKFSEYKVGGNNTREASTRDPVDNVARDIAIREAKDALIKKGKKVKAYMDAKDEEFGSKFNMLVQSRLKEGSPSRERIYALAKAQIESASAAKAAEDDVDIPELPEPTEAVEAGQEAA